MGRWLQMRDYLTLKVTGTENKKYLFECKDAKSESGHSLVVTAEATHAAIVNGNLRFYRPDRMMAGTHTWTPKGQAPRPVLLNHDRKGNIFGRVHAAKYHDLSYLYQEPSVRKLLFYSDAKTDKKMTLFQSIDWIQDNLAKRDDYKGLGYIGLDMNITEPSAIDKVMRKEWLNVSVSFATNACLCSICHQDWAVDGPCEHELGERVGSKRCFAITGDFVYQECSLVNFPADPWGMITASNFKDLADSMENRVFFMGLSINEQDAINEKAGGLLLADGFNFGADIRPSDTDFDEQEGDMKELAELVAEINSDGLTAERAFAIASELEGRKSEKGAKRALSTLRAKIKANDWKESTGGVTQEDVQAKVNGLEDTLVTLADDAARAAYRAQVEDEARAFGIEVPKPVADLPTTSQEGDPAATAQDAETADVTAQGEGGDPAPAGNQLSDEAVSALAQANIQFSDAKKDAALGLLGQVETYLKGCESGSTEQYVFMEALDAVMSCVRADRYLNYLKGRIEKVSNGSDSVVPTSELATLHDAVEKYEADSKKAAEQNGTLTKANLALVADMKKTLASILVSASVLLGEKGYVGLSADEINQEIERKSGRALNSLKDSVEDLLRKLPGYQATSEPTPQEGAREVADTATTVSDQDGPVDDTEGGGAGNGQDDLDPVKLTRILGPREAQKALYARRAKQKTNSKE